MLAEVRAADSTDRRTDSGQPSTSLSLAGRFELDSSGFEQSTKNEHVHFALFSNGVVVNQDAVGGACDIMSHLT